MHNAARTFVTTALVEYGQPSGLTVEVGGRNINGTIRDLFPGPYVAIDTVAGPGVDVVADGTTYQPEQPAACVVCCEVLEHTPDAEAICAHAYAMLDAGGLFLVTAAGEGRLPHSAVDGGVLREGEFYANVTEADLRAWLAPFAGVEIRTHPKAGDIYAVALKGEA